MPTLLPRGIGDTACTPLRSPRPPPRPGVGATGLDPLSLPRLLPPPPPLTVGSGKVAKCRRGHYGNKSSLVPHLQAPGCPSLLLTPHPGPRTKLLLSWPRKKPPAPTHKGLGAEAWTAEGGWAPRGAGTLFLPPWFTLFLSRGGPPKPFIRLHIHIKTSREKTAEGIIRHGCHTLYQGKAGAG